MIEHIRGDTFDFSGPLGLSAGGSQQVDFTGWTGRSMVRLLDGTFVAELDVTWVNEPQGIIRLRAQNTSGWQTGKAQLDIQMTSPAGDVVSTKAVLFEIKRDVTYD